MKDADFTTLASRSGIQKQGVNEIVTVFLLSSFALAKFISLSVLKRYENEEVTKWEDYVFVMMFWMFWIVSSVICFGCVV